GRRTCNGMHGVAPGLAESPRFLAPTVWRPACSLTTPGQEEARAMSRIMASIALLLLAVIHGPSQAQALVFSVFQDLLPFGTTNEPITLFLTGMALLSLAQLGRPRSQ